MEVTVLDFDGTIYKGDSSIDFYLYSLRKDPSIIRFLPYQIKGGILYLMGIIEKTKFKEMYFSFLSGIDGEKMAETFWQSHEDKIYKWYLARKSKYDIIISASPEFLLRPICNKLGIEHLIASKVDRLTGRFLRENCYGEEKVVRLKEEYKIEKIDYFFSDSESDLPLVRIAKKAYLIKKGKVVNWIL